MQLLHVSVLASDLPLDQGSDRPVRQTQRRSSSTAARCSRRASRRWSGSPPIRSTSPSPTARSSRTSGATSRSRRRPRSPGRVREGGRRRGRVHRGADRGRRARRRRRPLPRDDAQGQGLPAHAAAGPRLLPVAPAPLERRPDRLAARRRSPPRSPAKANRLAAVSHDTDKLIRQLSLVAFLMAERRPLTARDVKGNVEGYSEMSDEAFARRFYSDRAELIALGVPLHSQRDEFTGEELYTLRSENYFLAELELDDDELAALQTALYMLEGKFAYAEPLRLALQNLALGRPGFPVPQGTPEARMTMSDPDYSPEMPGPARQARGRDLEAAHGQVQLLVAAARPDARADAQPLRPAPRPRHLVRRRPRPRRRGRAHVPRFAHPRRDPLRHAPRARLPAAGRVRRRPLPRPARRGRSATPPARRGSRSPATRPGGSSACTAARGGSRTASSSRSTRASSRSCAGSCVRTAGRSRSRRRHCVGK